MGTAALAVQLCRDAALLAASGAHEKYFYKVPHTLHTVSNTRSWDRTHALPSAAASGHGQ